MYTDDFFAGWGAGGFFWILGLGSEVQGLGLTGWRAGGFLILVLGLKVERLGLAGWGAGGLGYGFSVDALGFKIKC